MHTSNNACKCNMVFTREELSSVIQPNTKRLCLFAHYSNNDEITPNTLEYVCELSRFFDQIIVLTNILDVSGYSENKVSFVTVPNRHLDIGMCMRVLLNADILEFDSIALVNDSCVLLKPMDFIFMSAQSRKFDGFWGICDSYETSHHIQSFFLVFEKKTLGALSDFVIDLKKMPIDDSVEKSEIGISTFMSARGFSLDVVFNWNIICKHESVVSMNGKKICDLDNPSYIYWDILIQLGCPLLKKKRLSYQNETTFIKDICNIKKTILLYIVYHDDDSGKKALSYAFKLAFTQPLIDTFPIRVSDASPYFESQVFEKIDISNHSKYEWIGVITHGFENKLGPNPPNIQHEVAKGQVENADVVSLFNLDFAKPRVNRGVSFIESIAMQHGPYMWMAIHHIFKIQGFNETEIMKKDIKGFFSNWWLAKPHVIAKYIKFFKICQKLVSTHPLISSYINNDSYYLGYAHKKTIETNRLLQIFGQEYYCLHPFLFERIPPIFIDVMGYKLYRGGVTAIWNLGD